MSFNQITKAYRDATMQEWSKPIPIWTLLGCAVVAWWLGWL